MQSSDSVDKVIFTDGPWQWEVLSFGHGPETLLAFHGFDNDAEDFLSLSPAFHGRYRFLSVQLFYHGHSRPINETTDFTTEELARTITMLLDRFRINRFSVIGYSLGGRIALCLLESLAHRIDRVFLLAADGLRIHPVYPFITRNRIGHTLFQRVKNDPSLFLRIAGLVKRLHLVGEKEYKFAYHHFNTPEKREKVYHVWMIHRHLLPDYKSVLRHVAKYRIRVDMVFGDRDTFMPPTIGDRWKKGAPDLFHTHVLEAGHHLLKPAIGEFLAALP